MSDPVARTHRAFSALFGLIAVGVTLGIAELIAALGQRFGRLHTASSPYNALGDGFIQLTPAWLKNWAIDEFGTHDKQALLAGMTVTMALVAVVVGSVSRSHLRPAAVVWVALVALALTAVWTRTDSSPVDGLPVLIGSLAGMYVLVRVHDARAADRRVDGVGAPRDRPRRQLLRFGLLGAGLAVLTGALARWIPSTADVEASRNRIRIPTPFNTQPDPVPSPALTPTSPARTPVTETSTAATTTSATTTTTAATKSVPPQAFSQIKGLTPFITPSRDFYRIDTTLSPPLLRAEDWTIRIHGLVDHEFTLDYQQLLAQPQIQRTLSLSCVSNEVGGHLIGNATWIGVRLDQLLRRAGVRTGADCVLSTSVDGFTCSTPLSALTDGRDAILAVAMNGAPLPIAHGFPVRMVVPGVYGYASATKWVTDLEVTRFADVSSYWTSRGYSEMGPVKMSSRIDVPVPYTPVSLGQTVTIAGVAWAQHQGISAVQVKIDKGPWLTTDLSPALSVDTWRLWQYSWNATAGSHVVICRAVDGSGRVQDGTSRGVIPNGATGYASLTIRVS